MGAPCGVMDQMASSLGDKQALMAMSCQPAEVQPEVPIPPHLKFWGLDSGTPLPIHACCTAYVLGCIAVCTAVVCCSVIAVVYCSVSAVVYGSVTAVMYDSVTAVVYCSMTAWCVAVSLLWCIAA